MGAFKSRRWGPPNFYRGGVAQSIIASNKREQGLEYRSHLRLEFANLAEAEAEKKQIFLYETGVGAVMASEPIL